jgi:hypothetical protein
MRVILLHFDGCPHWQILAERLEALSGELDFTVERQVVDTPEAAEAVGFRGSPTVLVDGIDPFADPAAPVGLSCRVYSTPEGLRGSPTEAMLRQALTAGRG